MDRFEKPQIAALEGQRIVFNFAGATGAVQSNEEAQRNLMEECHPQLGLFQASAQLDPSPMVVFCSSRLVYGSPQYLPVDEAHPLAPASMYAVHKITLERYLHVFAQTDGLPFCVLRVSNPYGPHAPAGPRTYGLINSFIRLAAEGRPLTIFGDGEQKRDYIYVDDTIIAFLVCAMTPGCQGRTFNLGGRRPLQIREAAEQIIRAAGKSTLEHVPWPQEHQGVETGDYVTDMSNLDGQIRLPPQINFQQGLRRTLAALD